MIKYFIILFLSLGFVGTVLGQQSVSGKVTFRNGEPVSGALVYAVNNPLEKTITGKEGIFALKAEKGDYIEVKFADANLKRVQVGDSSLMVLLDEKSELVNNLNRTTSEYRNTIASSKIGAEVFSRNDAPNTYDALFGQLSGLTLIQDTEYDSSPSRKAIRGRAGVLYIVDGFPRSLETINPADIESVTVLKDGAATALYGTMGANGVIVVTTKRGSYNSYDVEVKYTRGFGIPVNTPEMADAATYAKAVNEGLYYDGLASDMFGKYSQQEIDYFANGTGDSDLYANTDWLDAASRDYSTSNQLDISFRGGGEKIRYFSSVNYKNNIGILNEDYSNYTNRYTSQIRNYNLSVRLNLDAEITKSTLFKVNMFASLKENNRPATEKDKDITDEKVGSISDVFNNLYRTPSASFPVRTQSGMWGSSDLLKMNPIAYFADQGFYKHNGYWLQTDFRIVQDLSAIAAGLKAEVALAYDNFALYREVGSKPYEYEINVLSEGDKVSTIGGQEDALTITNTNLDNQYMKPSVEAQLSYNHVYNGVHGLNALLLYRQNSFIVSEQSQSMYRVNTMLQLGYDYKGKYLLDVLVNRAGTSVLAEGDKFRTYPAVSAGWVMSNEDFLKNVSAIDFLKLRASYGKNGYDAIDNYLDKQFWGGGNSYFFGATNNKLNGSSEKSLAMDSFTIESSDKYNIGVDVDMFKHLSMSIDAFMDKRRDMLVDGAKVVSGVIGIGVPKQNVGAEDYKGLEVSAMWKGGNNDFKYYIGGNMSLLKSEVIENGEGYKPYDYMYAKGHPVGQAFGLEAIGYFNDQTDIETSPVQQFSVVRPGDVKYKDQNNDKVIDEFDVLAIGKSTNQPGLYYGFNLGAEYKGFGFNAVFQGIGQYSVFLNTTDIYWPLRNNSNISTWYLEDKVRWTEATKATANLPRLTTMDNDNNFRKSTQWLVDGSYLKLRNLQVYYNLPESVAKKMKMENVQISLSGNNLLSFDNVPYLNSEDIAKDYFDMMSVYAGIKINF